jgi:competence protein ComEA
VPTPGEKKALLFLSLVGVLGAGSRLVAANQIPLPTSADVKALDAQIGAVDSVRRGRSAGTAGRRKARAARGQVKPRSSGGRRDASGDEATRVAARNTQAGPLAAPSALRLPPLLVDVDRASIEELQSLPGIGPALARRIVANRDSSGTFGSIDDLTARVRGIGPALAKRLAPAVTFSGSRSPPSAERTEPFGNGRTPPRPQRRRVH